MEFNGGDKYSCVSGDGEDKIIVVEQPKRDRKLPFTYFGMEIDTHGLDSSIESYPQKQIHAAMPQDDNADNDKDDKIIVDKIDKPKQKETQLVSVELSTEEIDEEFVLEFLDNNIINIIYKNTFAYATKLIEAVQQEYYSEDDPPFYFFEYEEDKALKGYDYL